MILFNGKKEAEKILYELREKIVAKGLQPRLAVILIGSDPASEIYVSLKQKAAKQIGVMIDLYRYEEKELEEKILHQIHILNDDPHVSGIIVQLPLPTGFDTNKIISAINSSKDADGFHPKEAQLRTHEKSNLTPPVLPWVLRYILQHAQQKSFETLSVRALVNSNIFGQTLKKYFSQNGIQIETLIFGEHTQDEITKFTQGADVLMSVIGKAHAITEHMLKTEAILIDAGISKKEGSVCGDFDLAHIKHVAFATPVPGGVGPMTIAGLLTNVVELEIEHQKKQRSHAPLSE